MPKKLSDSTKKAIFNYSKNHTDQETADYYKISVSTVQKYKDKSKINSGDAIFKKDSAPEKKKIREDHIDYMEKSTKYRKFGNTYYRNMGNTGYKGVIERRSEKGVKINGTWYPKKATIETDGKIYVMDAIHLKRKKENVKRRIDNYNEEIKDLENEIKYFEPDPFSEENLDQVIKRNKKDIKEIKELLPQYEKRLADMDKTFDAMGYW